MSGEAPEYGIVRIHGKPEDWLRDFLESELAQYAGRVYGACVILCIVEPGEESCGTRAWYDWPSKLQLIGALQVSATKLAREVAEP